MRTPTYDAAALKRLLETERVCTLDDMMQALGTQVRMTVFRKLSELSYLTSYSHRGKYYTLRALCRVRRRRPVVRRSGLVFALRHLAEHLPALRSSIPRRDFP